MTKEEFLKDIDNFSSHRNLLWEALEATKGLGLPVLELGCGDGSSPFLKQYCLENKLELFSYDFHAGWAAKYGSVHVTNWENIPWSKDYGVVLIDHSPGSHRLIAIENLRHVIIQIVHDSEPLGWNASDYQVRPLFSKFKYQFDWVPGVHGDAWTTALSNTINVSTWQK